MNERNGQKSSNSRHEFNIHFAYEVFLQCAIYSILFLSLYSAGSSNLLTERTNADRTFRRRRYARTYTITRAHDFCFFCSLEFLLRSPWLNTQPKNAWMTEPLAPCSRVKRNPRNESPETTGSTDNWTAPLSVPSYCLSRKPRTDCCAIVTRTTALKPPLHRSILSCFIYTRPPCFSETLLRLWWENLADPCVHANVCIHYTLCVTVHYYDYHYYIHWRRDKEATIDDILERVRLTQQYGRHQNPIDDDVLFFLLLSIFSMTYRYNLETENFFRRYLDRRDL